MMLEPGLQMRVRPAPEAFPQAFVKGRPECGLSLP